MAQRPSPTTDHKSNHVTPPTQLTGHEESKRGKKGELKWIKATPFANGKLEGSRNYTRAQFYSREGQTEHCAGESRGANWLRMYPWCGWDGHFFEGGLWRMEDGGEGDQEVVWGVSASLVSFDSFESSSLYPNYIKLWTDPLSDK